MTFKEIGDLLRIVRNIKIEDMARETGLKTNTLYQFEAGTNHSKVLVDYYTKQAEFFELDMIYNAIKGSRALLKLTDYVGGM